MGAAWGGCWAGGCGGELDALGDAELDLCGQGELEVEVEVRGRTRNVPEHGDMKDRRRDESERGGEHLDLLTRAHASDTS